MRLINLEGRLHLSTEHGAVDVAKASEGRFGPDPQSIYDTWNEFTEWTASNRELPQGVAFDDRDLGPPVPSPRQIFAVGLNYQAHADESGFVAPTEPVIFTKFVSSLTGPNTEIALPDGSVDWEVELVVVIGAGGRAIPADEGWRHVAGVTVGQDLSERQRQHYGPAPQFSLAKSHEGFSPLGPAVVTVDELHQRDDLELGAFLDDEPIQHGRTSQMIFPVPELIARLSGVVELLPGDLIFTGTPAGVGAGRVPPRFLHPGAQLRSYVAGVGEMTQTFIQTAHNVAATNSGA